MAVPGDYTRFMGPPQRSTTRSNTERKFRSLDPIEGEDPHTPKELSCSLRNNLTKRLLADGVHVSPLSDPDVHPVFNRDIFQKATQCTHSNHTLPFSTGSYKRIRPALKLASRALVDRRYLTFWASLAHCGNAPKSGPWTFRLFTEDEVTQMAAAHTHRQLMVLASSMCYIAHSTHTEFTHCRAQMEERIQNGVLAIHVTFNADYYSPLLSQAAWEKLTSVERTTLLFDFAMVLLHEVAHAFVAFGFFNTHKTYLLKEPVIDELPPKRNRTGGGEVGRAFDHFFVGDCLDRIDLNGPSVSADERTYVHAMWVFVSPADSDDSVNGPRPEDPARPNVGLSVPLPWIEARFQESWFQTPYPRWDLRKASGLFLEASLTRRNKVPVAAERWIERSLEFIFPAQLIQSFMNSFKARARNNTQETVSWFLLSDWIEPCSQEQSTDGMAQATSSHKAEGIDANTTKVSKSPHTTRRVTKSEKTEGSTTQEIKETKSHGRRTEDTQVSVQTPRTLGRNYRVGIDREDPGFRLDLLGRNYRVRG